MSFTPRATRDGSETRHMSRSSACQCGDAISDPGRDLHPDRPATARPFDVLRDASLRENTGWQGRASARGELHEVTGTKVHAKEEDLSEGEEWSQLAEGKDAAEERVDAREQEEPSARTPASREVQAAAKTTFD
jgi:hypothetical protein